MHWLPAILIIPYLFLLLRIYRSLFKTKSFNISVEPGVFVSVVVACRNEQENLPLLIKCIVEQEYPKELFEVIIVDDNSYDRTYEIASDSAGLSNIFAIKNDGNGKKKAIRTGINASIGSLIITTDADCVMGKRWLATIAAFYEKYRPDMIICPVQIQSVPHFFGRFQELEFLGLQGITAGTAISGDGTMCNGANLAFTRKAYFDNQNNLRDEIDSGDDIFLLHSLKKEKKSRILWVESSDAMVTTIGSSSPLSFLKQRSRWISKAKEYNDRYTIIIGIVTFVTIFVQLSVLVAVFFNRSFIPVLITVYALTAIPDFLILMNTSLRYGRSKLLLWFFPAQIIYPFYVLSVMLYTVYRKK